MVDPVEVRAVSSCDEREYVRQLLQSEFEVAPGVGTAFADLYDQLLDHDPSCSLTSSRIAVLGDEVVGHAFLAPRSIRICEGDCPGGLVGLVVVHPEHRRKGIGSALIDDVHALAKEQGLGLLVLAGDPAFYRRFGYHNAFVRPSSEVTSPFPSSPWREIRPDDHELLTTLSQSQIAPGSVTPTGDRWAWHLSTGHTDQILKTNPVILGHSVERMMGVIETRGEGYARVGIGEGRATVYEAGVVDRDAAIRLLGALGEVCGDAKLMLRLPEWHLLVETAGGETEDVADPEFQFRVVNLDIMLAEAGPGLEARCASSCPDWRGAFLMKTENGFVGFDRKEGALEARRVNETFNAPDGYIEIPEWGLGRMLLGQDDLARAARGGGRLDLVLEAFCGSRRPVFGLSDAI